MFFLVWRLVGLYLCFLGLVCCIFVGKVCGIYGLFGVFYIFGLGFLIIRGMIFDIF